jgi:hypothetical protein
MRTVKYVALAGLTLGVLGAAAFQADKAKPKYDIETIMDKAHQPKDTSLFKKVAGGKATAEQKKELLSLYEELAKNKPEKGSLEDWKKRTTAAVAAAKEVVDDKPGATARLAKAINCKGCHDEHQ